jgi:hypothetical protein
MPSIPNPGIAPLIGSWRLESVENTFSDTKERIEPFGPNPDGRMVLEPGGRIIFLFTKSDRQPPVTDAARAAQFNELAAYTGLVRLDGPGQLITTVDLAWNPTFGGEQRRFYVLDGDRLTIRTPEQTIPLFPGRLMVGELVWVREHPPYHPNSSC